MINRYNDSMPKEDFRYKASVKRILILVGYGFGESGALYEIHAMDHDLNHSSCRRSVAVGRSLGSNFINFAIKSLSSLSSSSSSERANGHCS